MRPVLFELFGVPVNSYGVSKVLAALAAAYLLGRQFRGRGWDPGKAWDLVIYATIAGFVGGKAYFLIENLGNLSLHHFGGTGFTWYGGLIAGAGTVLFLGKRYGLPLGTLAGMTAVPLSVAYGIGRLGCFLAGDGTYGRPTDLPWGMSFPNGVVPTTERVHPTALYEALAAFVLAFVLSRVRDRVSPLSLFGIYAVASGAIRVLVETVRINEKVVAGLTQPQIWSLALMVLGGVLIARGRHESANEAQSLSAARALPSGPALSDPRR